MTLKQQLDATRDRLSLNPIIRSAVEATVAELTRSGFLAAALRTGDRFPDFLLPNADGSLVSLVDLLAPGPIVITFFRGNWCPYCSLMLAALEDALPQIAEAGGRLLAITPETGGLASDARQTFNLHYDVLVDVDSDIGTQCGVVFRPPEPYRNLLTAASLSLPLRQGTRDWLLPVPAAYVIDRTGVIRWHFLDVDFTRRAEPADLIQALRTLA